MMLSGQSFHYQMHDRLMIGPIHINVIETVRRELEDVLRSIPERASTDQDAYEQAKILNGRILFVNNNRLVHEWDCPTIRGKPADPQRVWRGRRDHVEQVLSDVEKFLREAIRGKSVAEIVTYFRSAPEMQPLLTASEVDEMKSYRACQICQPLLQQSSKSASRGSVALINIKPERVGRRYVTPDGQSLGRLKGIRVIAEFEQATLEGHETRVELSD